MKDVIFAAAMIIFGFSIVSMSAYENFQNHKLITECEAFLPRDKACKLIAVEDTNDD